MSKASGEAIKKRRAALNLTQSKLAALLNGGRIIGENGKSTISKYEHGTNFSIDVLCKLANALECEPNYLVGWDEHPTRVETDIAKELPLDLESIQALRTLKAECDQGYDGSRISADFISHMIKYICSSEGGDWIQSIMEFAYSSKEERDYVGRKRIKGRLTQKISPAEARRSQYYREILSRIGFFREEVSLGFRDCINAFVETIEFPEGFITSVQVPSEVFEEVFNEQE